MLPKPIKDLAVKIGFKSDNAQIWGYYKGYPLTLACYGQEKNLTIFSAISLSDPFFYSTLDTFFVEMEKAKKITSHKSSHGSFTLTKTYPLTGYKLDELQSLLDEITEKYQQLGASPACFNCNQIGEMGYARYNGVALPLCNSCFEQMKGKINQNLEQHNAEKNNYLSGTIGAVLGALVGTILWVVIGLLGYLAAIAGLAIAFASAKGYTLFKGKITRITPWIIGLSTLFALIIGQFVTLDLIFYQEFKDSISLGDALSLTFQLPFLDPEIMSAFIKDTLLGLVFAALGAFGTIKRLAVMGAKPAGSIERI